jgi:hypothetical protein
VTVDPGLEAPRPADGEAFSDAVTFAFGDPRADVYGLARAGVAGGATASGLAVLFSGGRPIAARAKGGEPLGAGDWEGVQAAGVRTTVEEPLVRWSVAFDGGESGGFELGFSALGEPAVHDAESPAAQAGGMEAYEQLCRVEGTATIEGRSVAIDCLGERGHSWGTPDWERISLSRALGAWFGEDLAVVLSSVRPAKRREHDAEAMSAVVLEGTPPAPAAITEPRLSTTYDGEGHQRRAGFELWPDGEQPVVRRGAGEVLCGTTLDLGRLRLDCAFFQWRMEGREGVGRYDVLRRG